MSTSDGSVVGKTQIVNNGDPAKRWNLVILGDGYQRRDLGKFETDANSFVATMRSTPPYEALWRAVNVYRIDVASTDSGAAIPTTCHSGQPRAHTYFDASFCNNGIDRLLEVDQRTVHAVVNARMPQAHISMVIVNSDAYGGSGGSVATVSCAPQVEEIAFHELGHTAFNLADEYEYYAGCGVDPPGTHDRFTGGDPLQINIATTDGVRDKWGHLLTPGAAVPTTGNADCANCDPGSYTNLRATVGAFEGAGFYHCGLYRPEYTCRMRELGQPYCAVCQSAISARLDRYRS
jgi:hypothetical protein